MYDKSEAEVMAGGCLSIIFLSLIISGITIVAMQSLENKYSTSKCIWCGQILNIEEINNENN